MDFSTANWRVREAVADDVPDILQMIKVLKRKFKIPQNQYATNSGAPNEDIVQNHLT